MAYTMYKNLGGPNDVLEKIRDFLVDNGFTILNNCTPDLDIMGNGVYDGEVLAAKYEDLYLVMRSANGYPIFSKQLNINGTSVHASDYGIGLTSCTSYTANPSSGYWFDQVNVPVDVSTQTKIGVGIPVNAGGNIKLYCNMVTEPAVSLVFSLELFAGVFQHLAIATAQKVGSWNGGTVMSGSRNSYRMFPASWTANVIESESNHLYGMSANPSTFLRADIDAAPLRQNPVLWAAAGPASGVTCSTGKILALPLLNISYRNSMPKVPHYADLQSQSSSDYGRNVNTLNCITVNMPLYLYVQRDPDALMNFSQVGYVPGVYAISMRNVAPAKTYEISYPKSGNEHQVFPHTKRGSVFGYDGIAITQ